jgi:hypothetical protein
LNYLVEEIESQDASLITDLQLSCIKHLRNLFDPAYEYWPGLFLGYCLVQMYGQMVNRLNFSGIQEVNSQKISGRRKVNMKDIAGYKVYLLFRERSSDTYFN